MTHPTDDQLLLYAYGELPGDAHRDLETHLGACAECRARFAQLERSRVALEWGMEGRSRASSRRMVWLALPIAAGIAMLLLVRHPQGVEPAERPVWQSHLIASPTAGYIAGGAAFMVIDSQLTQLEQGRTHATHRN